jgi:hypothetical protein
MTDTDTGTVALFRAEVSWSMPCSSCGTGWHGSSRDSSVAAPSASFSLGCRRRRGTARSPRPLCARAWRRSGRGEDRSDTAGRVQPNLQRPIRVEHRTDLAGATDEAGPCCVASRDAAGHGRRSAPSPRRESLIQVHPGTGDISSVCVVESSSNRSLRCSSPGPSDAVVVAPVTRSFALRGNGVVDRPGRVTRDGGTLRLSASTVERFERDH